MSDYIYQNSPVLQTFKVTEIAETDDSTFTFRVSSRLKEEFSKLCREEHLSSATALKRYMSRCVSKGRIVN
jgi:hypothetical protein